MPTISPSRMTARSCWILASIPSTSTEQAPPKEKAPVYSTGASRINSLTMSYFHTGTRNIIGAEAFHCPVRDGKEWYHLAMVIRHNRRPRTLRPVGQFAESTACAGNQFLDRRPSVRRTVQTRSTPLAIDDRQSYRVKPHEQLVLVSLTGYPASTPSLSTSWSRTTLQGAQGPGKTHLETSFPLRCFQRLSLPHIATRQCHWRDNRYTRGASTPVLSY